MDLKTATPAEIDTRYVELRFELSVVSARRDQCQRIVKSPRKYLLDAELDSVEQDLHRYQQQAADLMGQIANIDDIYNERGQWPRVWVVPGGHAHRSQYCHSLYASTVLVLAPRDVRKRDLSGATEEEIVAAVGERACTFCYPTSPVDKPSTIVLPDEDAKMKARAEREAKRQEAAEKKAAKAITHPDGSRIKIDIWYVDTEAEARRRYVEAYANALWGAYGMTPRTLEERQDEVEPLLIALAHKHGKTVEEMREELAPKIVAKAKRDQRAAIGHAKALGLPLR